METIRLKNGKSVSKADYVQAKTLDLIDWGYTSLTEQEVGEQVDKILNGNESLTVIGLFCQDDIDH